MSKTPEEMAEEYCNTKQLSYVERLVITKGFIDGYKAAKAIVEEELQAVQAQRAESPGLGGAEYALKNVMAKMGGK